MNRFIQYSCSLSVKSMLLFLFLSLFLMWVFIFSHLPISNNAMLQIANGHGLFDVMTFYDAAIVNVMLFEYGEIGRRNYLIFQFFDFLFIPCYVLGLTALAVRVYKVSGKPNCVIVWLCYMPALLGISDALENISLIVLVIHNSDQLMLLGDIAGYLTLLKHLMTLVVMLVLIVGCINRMKIRARRR